MTYISRLAAALMIVMLSVPASAREVEFPDGWAAGGPMSIDDFQGKVLVLYCVTVFGDRESVQGISPTDAIAAASRYHDEPVKFVAVVGGAAQREAVRWAQRVGLRNWAILADTSGRLISDLDLERADAGQVIVVHPDGAMKKVEDIEDGIDAALGGAAWDIEPGDVPEPLLEVWRDYEMADYARALNRARRHRKSQVKPINALANRIIERIDQRFAAEKARAEQLVDAGEGWAAYKIYRRLTDQYEGHPGTLDVIRAMKRLRADDDDVDRQRDAEAALERAGVTLSSYYLRDQKRGLEQLDAIIRVYPGTEAAEAAANIRAARRLAGPSVRP